MKTFIEILKITAFVAVAITASIIASTLTGNISLIEIKIITREAITCLIVLLAFILFSKYWDRVKSKDSILLKEKSKGVQWIKGCVLGIIMIALTSLILILAGWINVERLGKSFKFALLPFITMLFTSFWEELVFRGFALNKLKTIVGKHTSAIIIALIFGLLHLLSPLKSPAIVVSTILSGLILNYAFLKKQSLYFPMGIHFAWNAFNNFLYGNVFFRIEYYNTIMAGLKNPEQGLVAISITFIALLYVLTLKPSYSMQT
ncbi:MAG: CPBP family intramembrane metalloprotease [Bacteroidales bacterium]|nr:CPBP family intramembrane metalloprotease [Bacteroidales bacterium]